MENMSLQTSFCRFIILPLSFGKMIEGKMMKAQAIRVHDEPAKSGSRFCFSAINLSAEKKCACCHRWAGAA
jgi:hypothetical protein